MAGAVDSGRLHSHCLSDDLPSLLLTLAEELFFLLDRADHRLSTIDYLAIVRLEVIRGRVQLSLLMPLVPCLAPPLWL